MEESKEYNRFMAKAQDQYDRAVQADKDAKLRRRFNTKYKLNIYPSDEQVEKNLDLAYYAEGGTGAPLRALIYPGYPLEDQYGYKDGVPEEFISKFDGKDCNPYLADEAGQSAIDGWDNHNYKENPYPPFKESYQAVITEDGKGSLTRAWGSNDELKRIELSGSLAKEYDENLAKPFHDIGGGYTDIIAKLKEIIEHPAIQKARKYNEGGQVTDTIKLFLDRYEEFKQGILAEANCGCEILELENELP